MAEYNYNGYYNGYGRRKRGSLDRRYRDDYDRNDYDRGSPHKKSGCKTGHSKSGNAWVSGWNKSAQGLMSFIAYPYKGERSATHEVKSKSGTVWENWLAKITYPDKKTSIVSVLVEQDTRRVFFRDINMIANPGAPNGGYFGTMIRKRR